MRSSKKRKWFSTLLALVLTVCLCAAPAAAVEQEMPEGALAAADALHTMGLFQGMGTDANGAPDYALGASATRNQAATMLIRLLGREDKAAAQYSAGTLKNPFTDTSWAAATVAWLYESGYVNGMGGSIYGGDETVTAQQFAAMILRSLGYSEAKGDYTYAGALDFAVKTGLLTQQQRSAWESGFLRGGMAQMCYNALHTNMRFSDLTLLEKLTNDGVFKDSYDTTVAGTAPMTLSLRYSGGGRESQYYVQEGTTASPCADVDNDGRKEIIFNVRDVFCLDAATGNVKWKTASGHDVSTPGAAFFGQNTLYVPTRIADLDNDGQMEIITFSTNYGVEALANPVSVLAVYDGTGRFKFDPIYFNYHVRAAEISDLDGDGTLEIAVGLGVGDYYPMTNAPSVYVYNCDGTLRPGWPADCGYGLYANGLEAVDLDGDGVKELVALNDQEWINAYHADGSEVRIASGPYAGKLWRDIAVWENYDFEQERNLKWAEGGTSRENSNSIGGTHGGVIAADVDGDGVKELVFTAMVIDNAIVHRHMNEGTGTSFSDSLQYFTTFILSRNHERYSNPSRGFDWTQMPTDIGEPLTLEDYLNLPDPDLRPVVADVDGDGNQEILFGSYDGRVHCFSLDGTEHGAWPFSLNGRSTSVKTMPARPAVADLNGDGKLEIVVATYPEMLAQPARRGTLYVLDYTGKILAQTTLPPQWGAAGGYNGSLAEPVLADVDNDGRLEIIVTTYSAGVCVYKVN